MLHIRSMTRLEARLFSPSAAVCDLQPPTMKKKQTDQIIVDIDPEVEKRIREAEERYSTQLKHFGPAMRRRARITF